MTIQLSGYSKTGMMAGIRANSGVTTSASVLYLYPSTVPFPSGPINLAGSVVPGSIVVYNSGNWTYSTVGNTITVTAGTTSANASAAGTLSWWALHAAASGNGAFVSDSIGLSGNGKIITVNTMTPTNGQSVTITFNLTLV